MKKLILSLLSSSALMVPVASFAQTYASPKYHDVIIPSGLNSGTSVVGGINANASGLTAEVAARQTAVSNEATARANAIAPVAAQAATAVQNVAGATGPTISGPALASAIGPYLANPTILNLPTTAIFQRDTRTGGTYGVGQGALSIQVSVAFPGLVEWRLNDIDAGTSTSYQTLDAAATVGMHTYSITVPAGFHRYSITLRPSGIDAADVTTAGYFEMGEVVAVIGQSLAVRHVHQYVDTTLSSSFGIPSAVLTYYSIYANWTGETAPNGPATTVWTLPVDGNIATSTYNSVYQNEFAYRTVTSWGVPVAYVGYTHGGQTAAQFAPGTANYISFVNTVTAAGGKFGTLIVDQGHSDSQAGTTAAVWSSTWTGTIAAIRAVFPGGPGFKTLFETIPDVTNTGWGNQAAIQVIRGAALALCAANPSTMLCDTPLDLELVDGTHPDQNGSYTDADHNFRAVSQAIGINSIGDQGPQITAATLATSVIHLTVAQAGGTALVGVGTPANQFVVYPTGTTSSPYTIASISFPSATDIDLTLSAPPGQSVDVWYRPAPDASDLHASGVYDNNSADPGITSSPIAIGRQLQMMPNGFFTAFAPPTIAANPAVGGTTYNATSTWDEVATFTGRTPTAISYSIDGGGFVTVTSPAVVLNTISFTGLSSGLSVGTHTIAVKMTNQDGTATSSTASFPIVSTWTPTSAVLAGGGQNPLAVWHDPSYTFSTYADTAFQTVQATAGGTVGGLLDLSGLGHHYVAFTTAPTLALTGINSLPTLTFAVANANVMCAIPGATWMGSLNAGSLALSTVFKPITLSTSPALRVVAAIGSTASNLDAVKMLQSTTTPNTTALSARYAGVNNGLTVANAVAVGAVAKEVFRFNSSTLLQELAINALTEATGTITGNLVINPWQTACMGAAPTTLTVGPYLDAQVGAEIVYSGALTDTDRTNLLAYETAKWGS